MRKIYHLRDLDCANCAAKMERAVEKLEGVNFVNFNFLTQKLVIDVVDDKFDEVMKQVVKIVKKVNSD